MHQVSYLHLYFAFGMMRTIIFVLLSFASIFPTTYAQCSNLLIDDWTSQSRLTFLFYNALLQSSSDDATMKSVVVGKNQVTYTPKAKDSYFYSQVGCLNAQNTYGGISVRIKAPRGTTFQIQLSSTATCGSGKSTDFVQTTNSLGWSFDGKAKLFTIPFSKFPGLDTSKITTILFSSLTHPITLGPMSAYCGDSGKEFSLPKLTTPSQSTATVAAPPGGAPSILVDNFANKDTNTMGNWHGGDEGMALTWGKQQLMIKSTDPDAVFYSQVSNTCMDMRNYDGSYLHIGYAGHTAFTVSLLQHNAQCKEDVAPYPETWDSVEASRYASKSDIYIPLSHFNIEKSRVVSVALKGFYNTDAVTIKKIEIVPSVPSGFKVPIKLPTGNLIFSCKRPNSFAFAIDDGQPQLAQKVMKIVKDAGIKVTFFTVGAALLDPTTNLTNVYNEMASQGHQIALHSYTHPKMEGLPDLESIDWEYKNDIAAVEKQLGGLHTPYFRPPFGTEGARMRQRLAVALGTDNPYIVNWSVDVQDWMWAESPTPEKQMESFQNDVKKGGNLVVMHYLYESTVSYLPKFIEIAKATGKQLMRVDQCMMDPNAPPL